MRYSHILTAICDERWAMHEAKLQAILDFLEAQARGEKLEASDIEARIGKQEERAVARKEGTVAIIPIRGVIANRMSMVGNSSVRESTSSEALSSLFQASLRDDQIKAIVFDIDSPGGAVSGTDELSAMIFNARGTKPIVAHVNATAASAAYWIASAADEVVVTPSGSVGSIGVFGVHEDISAKLEKDGVRKTIIKAGKFKASGNPYGPLDEETAARMQARVDQGYDMFVRAVARNRGKPLTAVRDGFGEGDMVLAEQALSEGMVDRIATLDETLQRFGVSLYGRPIEKRRATAFERERRALADF
ncbi:S49 family peptidase [Hyphomonas sp.]|uniref:S49 family peptidase n=1 Tax=Hyphomonas sp. TaxID=87 RepID=UPI000A8368DA|nr:S49 family peptidase [Hyphomonas sp.]